MIDPAKIEIEMQTSNSIRFWAMLKLNLDDSESIHYSESGKHSLIFFPFPQVPGK